MTSKESQSIALALARTRPASLDNPNSTSEFESSEAVGQWRIDIQAIADVFRAHSASFQRDRFLDTCYERL